MFHLTNILYFEWQEGNDSYKVREKFNLCLLDVSGILPGDEKDETIIFLQGRDMVIAENFDKFNKIWENAKRNNKAGDGKFKKTNRKKKSKNILLLNPSHPLNSSNSSGNKRNS